MSRTLTSIMGATMSLPEEVLRLLGDDATPEQAVLDLEGVARDALDVGLAPTPILKMEARRAWESTLAAAAIRLAEATITDVEREGLDGGDQWIKALTEYRAIRNWKKP